MGVNKTTSDAALWGDSGRYRLVIELSKQVFAYVDRLSEMNQSNSTALVRLADCKQRSLGLLWYKILTKLGEVSCTIPHHRVHFPSRSRTELRKLFVQTWNVE